MDELRETHISRVLPRGDRAYKLKKPLRLADEEAAGAVEYVVEMRRYDESSTLARRLDAGVVADRAGATTASRRPRLPR